MYKFKVVVSGQAKEQCKIGSLRLLVVLTRLALCARAIECAFLVKGMYLCIWRVGVACFAYDEAAQHVNRFS